MTTLTGARLRLRPIGRADLAASITWRNDADTRALVMGYPFPVTEDMEAAWYDRMLADQGGKRASFGIADLESGALIGFIHLMDIDWVCRSCELGIVIGDKARRGQNFGQEAAQLAVDYAFSGLNLCRIGARVLASNERAITMFRALGFQQEGCLREAAFADGAKINVVMLGLLAGDHDGRS
jgi:RimJ/RimL family protein N-acetyltransferase